jgi:hypothetical protein
MTREESWEVEGVTRTLLRHVTSLGYTVSVFVSRRRCWAPDRLASKCMRSTCRKNPPVKHVARVVEGEGGDLDYRCACLLAELVGNDLKDGRTQTAIRCGSSHGTGRDRNQRSGDGGIRGIVNPVVRTLA